MQFIDLIKSTGYITVSKELIRELGLNETIILSELISQYDYFKKRNELDHEGYFYCTIKKLENHTTLGKKAQTRAINKLVKLNLINTELKGLPAKRHFLIIEKNIIQLLLGKNYTVKKAIKPDTSSLTKRSKLERPKGANINNNIYIKTEEEEANFISKISNKYQQIYNRKLSVEFYQKMTDIYSNANIILKSLEIAELNSDKPAYILKILQDWANNGLKTVKEVNIYLDKRQAKNSIKKSNSQVSANKQSMENLYKNGYK